MRWSDSEKKEKRQIKRNEERYNMREREKERLRESERETEGKLDGDRDKMTEKERRQRERCPYIIVKTFHYCENNPFAGKLITYMGDPSISNYFHWHKNLYRVCVRVGWGRV